MQNRMEISMETGGISKLPLVSWEWRKGKENRNHYNWLYIATTISTHSFIPSEPKVR